MTTYDPTDWLKALALHKSDTFRKLIPLLVLVGLFTWGVGYVEIHYLKLSTNNLLSNLPIMHSILGFAISMLLVFRTNTAYDRWWEGRKLWGQLVNTTRNLALKLDAHLPPEATGARALFLRTISLFPKELKEHLQQERTRLALDELPHPELPDLDRSKHVPAQLVKAMQHQLLVLLRKGHLTGEQALLLDREVAQFMEICGACERIKNTPIPYSYSSFIKKFIVVYVLTLPFGFVFSLGYLAIPVVMFIFYVMASLEIIAEEIEDPFGTDANDLPMERLSEMIARNVADILQ